MLRLALRASLILWLALMLTGCSHTLPLSSALTNASNATHM